MLPRERRRAVRARAQSHLSAEPDSGGARRASRPLRAAQRPAHSAHTRGAEPRRPHRTTTTHKQQLPAGRAQYLSQLSDALPSSRRSAARLPRATATERGRAAPGGPRGCRAASQHRREEESFRSARCRRAARAARGAEGRAGSYLRAKHRAAAAAPRPARRAAASAAGARSARRPRGGAGGGQGRHSPARRPGPGNGRHRGGPPQPPSPPPPPKLPRHPPAGRRRRGVVRSGAAGGRNGGKVAVTSPAARCMSAARRSSPRLVSPRSSSSPPPPPGEPGRAGPHLPPGRPEAATGPAWCPPDPHCPPRCGLSRRPPSAAPRGCGDARGVPRRSPAPLCAEGLRCAETGRPRPGCWSSRPAQPPQRKSLCAYKRVLLKSPRTLLSLSLQMEKRRAETSLPQIATRLSHRLSRNLNFRPML